MKFKLGLILLAVAAFLFIPLGSFAYDSFDSPLIDSNKWEESDHKIREILNGNLRIGASGSTRRHTNQLFLTTPVTGYLESKIAVESGSMVSGNGYGYARVGGYFYNNQLGPGSYNEYQGNVWGHIKIVLESDNTLKAVATLYKATAPDESGETFFEQEFVKSIDFDTEYTVSMELSGSQFIFRCDEEEIIYQIQTETYAPYEPVQILGTRIYPDEGSAVSVKALFDDVSVVKNAIYDSFDSDFIDSNKWGENDHSVREINNGKLRMNEYGTTRRFSTYLHLTTPVTGYLESKITVESGSQVLGDGTGYARIGAYFYNSELGPGSYNEYQGNVWSEVRIVLENDNSLSATVSLWKTTEPDQSAGPVIFDQAFTKSINFDTEYTVSMELSGSQFIFRCDEEEIIYQIQTQIYEPYEPYQHLCTRIYPDEGSAVSVKALFDDVSVDGDDYDGDGVPDGVDTDDDNDGISDEEEASGPNNGDSNEDGTQDSLQANVGSLKIDGTQDYVTLESPADTDITECTNSETPTDAPEAAVFDYGLFEFTLGDIAAGGTTTVTLTFPDDAPDFDTYYKFGPTSDNVTPHWYEFKYDAATETGAKIDNTNHTITLYFKDGARGDDDLTANGTVVDIGGPARTVAADDANSDSGGGGGGGGCFISSMVE